jgi:hypothetical protein
MTLLNEKIIQAKNGEFFPLSKKELEILLDDFSFSEFTKLNVEKDSKFLLSAIGADNNKIIEQSCPTPSAMAAYSIIRWLHTGRPIITTMLSESGALDVFSSYEKIALELGLNSTLISRTEKLHGSLSPLPLYVVTYDTLISQSLVMELSPESGDSYIRSSEILVPNGAPFVTGELPLVSVPVSHLESTSEQTLNFSNNTFKFIFSKINSGDIDKDREHFDVDHGANSVRINKSGLPFIKKLWKDFSSDSKAEPGLYNLYCKLVISALEAFWLYEPKIDYGFLETGELVWSSNGGSSWSSEVNKPDSLNSAIMAKHGIALKKSIGKQVLESMNSYELIHSSKQFCICLPVMDRKAIRKEGKFKKCELIKQCKNSPLAEYDMQYASGQRAHQSVLNNFLMNCKEKGVNATVVVRTDSMKSSFVGLPSFVSVKTHYELLDTTTRNLGRVIVFEHPSSKLVLESICNKVISTGGASSLEVFFCSVDSRFEPGSNEGIALDVASSNYALSSGKRAKKRALKALLDFWKKHELDLRKRSENAISISGELRSEVRKVINHICKEYWGLFVLHEFSINKLLGGNKALICESLAERKRLINSNEGSKLKSALKHELLSIYYQYLTIHSKSNEVAYLSSVLSGSDFSYQEQSERIIRGYLKKLEDLL